MNLVDFVPLISEDQDIIVLYKLNTLSEEYEKIGEYWDIIEIPLIYAHKHINVVEGFNADGYNGIKILVM
jgi:hypothetical protein